MQEFTSHVAQHLAQVGGTRTGCESRPILRPHPRVVLPWCWLAQRWEKGISEGRRRKKSRKLSFSEAVSKADPGLPFDPTLKIFAFEWDGEKPFGLRRRCFYTDAGGVGECRVSGRARRHIRLLDTGVFLGWRSRLGC